MDTASNADKIAAFLAGKGLSKPDIAGLMGNFQVESSFNPAALNKKEGAIGIAQWERGRRTALDQYAAQTGGSEQSLATQEGYLWSELSGPYSSVLDAIRGMTDPAQVAAYVDAKYEVSAGTSRAKRVADAQAIYQQMQAGGTLGGITTSGSAGTSTSGGAKSLLGIPSASDIGKIVFEGAVVFGGLALIVVGLARATQPARDSITSHLPKVI